MTQPCPGRANRNLETATNTLHDAVNLSALQRLTVKQDKRSSSCSNTLQRNVTTQRISTCLIMARILC